jgi:hypothetical protein
VEGVRLLAAGALQDQALPREARLSSLLPQVSGGTDFLKTNKAQRKQYLLCMLYTAGGSHGTSMRTGTGSTAATSAGECRVRSVECRVPRAEC